MAANLTQSLQIKFYLSEFNLPETRRFETRENKSGTAKSRKPFLHERAVKGRTKESYRFKGKPSKETQGCSIFRSKSDRFSGPSSVFGSICKLCLNCHGKSIHSCD